LYQYKSALAIIYVVKIDYIGNQNMLRCSFFSNQNGVETNRVVAAEMKNKVDAILQVKSNQQAHCFAAPEHVHLWAE